MAVPCQCCQQAHTHPLVGQSGNVGSASAVTAGVNAGVKLGHVAAQNWATLGLRGRCSEGGGQSAALFM
jgi:hypothetical protein